ncbi:hypothetical protein HRR82_001230 [Exophiala dermatitidis]|nr:hypothetical protein HRR73_000324 [Exophiala dermatitidis]KAJ4587422.1 hypothetical protein HRR82_001230 [Exophiala dermatitidis]
MPKVESGYYGTSERVICNDLDGINCVGNVQSGSRKTIFPSVYPTGGSRNKAYCDYCPCKRERSWSCDVSGGLVDETGWCQRVRVVNAGKLEAMPVRVSVKKCVGRAATQSQIRTGGRDNSVRIQHLLVLRNPVPGTSGSGLGTSSCHIQYSGNISRSARTTG